MLQLAINVLQSKAGAETQHPAQASCLWGRRASRLPKQTKYRGTMSRDFIRWIATVKSERRVAIFHIGNRKTLRTS